MRIREFTIVGTLRINFRYFFGMEGKAQQLLHYKNQVGIRLYSAASYNKILPRGGGYLLPNNLTPISPSSQGLYLRYISSSSSFGPGRQKTKCIEKKWTCRSKCATHLTNVKCATLCINIVQSIAANK